MDPRGKSSSSRHTKHRPAIYKRLLEPKRLRPTPKDYKREQDLETFSDKGRIVRSSPFRRLHSKAQVFSMSPGGAVRTRLTHSIEVSDYGELIAESLAHQLVKSGDLLPELHSSFVRTVENACLLHDIGNPPFGHMGEYAIREWFKENKPKLHDSYMKQGHIGGRLADRHLDAYRNFDGNPQGFRIITHLQWLYDAYGMNLTCPLLASYMKYLGEVPEARRRLYKKTGYFPSEEDTVKKVWEKLDLSTRDGGLPNQRHPLVFLMEAADDIAFCLSDIEDAIEKGVVTEEEFISWMRPKNISFLEEAIVEAPTRPLLSKNGKYHLFRLKLSRTLVDSAVRAYVENQDQILDGTMGNSLLETNTQATRLLELVKEFCSLKVYTSRDAIDTELAGLNAIKGLLNGYLPVLCLSSEDFKEVSNPNNRSRLRDYPIASLLTCLLPDKHMQAYKWATTNAKELEPIYRTQLIVDYISGMTDAYVLKIFNMINGTQQFSME